MLTQLLTYPTLLLLLPRAGPRMPKEPWTGRMLHRALTSASLGPTSLHTWDAPQVLDNESWERGAAFALLMSSTETECGGAPPEPNNHWLWVQKSRAPAGWVGRDTCAPPSAQPPPAAAVAQGQGQKTSTGSRMEASVELPEEAAVPTRSRRKILSSSRSWSLRSAQGG